MKLPAKTRKEFDNDPMAFVKFAEDPANLEQMRAWGLAPAAAKPEASDPPAPPEAPNEPPAAK